VFQELRGRYGGGAVQVELHATSGSRKKL
jgi:hypothetical protein